MSKDKSKTKAAHPDVVRHDEDHLLGLTVAETEEFRRIGNMRIKNVTKEMHDRYFELVKKTLDAVGEGFQSRSSSAR